MNYLKVFWYVWKNSFSRTAYYKDVLKDPFSFSFKYFLFFCFLMSLVITVFLAVKIFIPLRGFLNRSPSIISQVYPKELEINIKNGIVTTNVAQPYFISVDRLEKGIEALEDVRGIKSDDIKNVFVIDTNASLDDMKRYQTYSLLTRQHFSYLKDDGKIETVSLENVKSFNLNENIIRGRLIKLLPLLGIIPFFLIPFILIGSFVFFTTAQLFYLLFTALILFIVAKLISFPLSYSKAYQMDLHLATIITPFFLLLSALNLKVEFPFLKLILFTVIGFYILNNLKANQVPLVKLKKSGKRN